MRIPKTFVSESDDLDKKVQELSMEEYKPKPKVSLEERALLEERLQEGYYTELKEKRKKWAIGNHLNEPSTDKTSPKRLILYLALMGASVVGATYFIKEVNDYIPDCLRFPSVFAVYLGFAAATYKAIAESMIRYDVWKKHKGKR